MVALLLLDPFLLLDEQWELMTNGHGHPDSNDFDSPTMETDEFSGLITSFGFLRILWILGLTIGNITFKFYVHILVLNGRFGMDTN